MNAGELKGKIAGLVGGYFAGAEVMWGRTKATKPRLPLVALSMGAVTRAEHPIVEPVDGEPRQCWPQSTAVQADLFTPGRKRGAQNVTAASENTAVCDMLAFLDFLGSEHCLAWCAENDLSIACSRVEDLTALENDTSWGYRAMAELEVSFTQYADGRAGTGTEYAQTPSGGGSPQLAALRTGWFEEVGYEEENDG
jgi:hypothetical protein